jgi:hypothetical protein
MKVPPNRKDLPRGRFVSTDPQSKEFPGNRSKTGVISLTGNKVGKLSALLTQGRNEEEPLLGSASFYISTREFLSVRLRRTAFFDGFVPN